MVEQGSRDQNTNKGSGDNGAGAVGVGTHAHENECQNRMKRLKEVIDEDEDEDWTKTYKNCPIQDCGFTPPQSSAIDEFDFNQEIILHITVRHPDYCIVCQVNNSHLFFSFFDRMPCQDRQW